MTIYGYFMWLVLLACALGGVMALVDVLVGWFVGAPDAEEAR